MVRVAGKECHKASYKPKSSETAPNATYAPFGALTGMQEGPSITITNSYSHRMEPVLISAQSAANTIYNLGYDFHYGNGDNGTVHQVVNYKNDNRTQNYTFDALNRIQTAYTNGPNWGEQYGIDTWGNMTARIPLGGKTMYEPLNVGAATAKNQFSNSSGFGYDADGNMTKNGGELYTYDAEDRLVTSDGYTYSYDGDGERVLKWNGSDGILYSNGVSGTAVEEDTPNDGWVYLFFNGQRVARDNGTPYYYMSDHLGSLGVVTDESGDIVQESDYYPYGGEMVITAGNGSGADNYKFTGKERDNESGLDNFGARYDSSALGRFMTPDWAARATAVPYAVYGDPQSLNLYGYVENSPINRADADGHVAPSMCGSGGQACKNEQVSAAINKFANSRTGQMVIGILEIGSAISTGGSTVEAAGAGAALKTAVGVIATSGLAVSGSTRILATAAGAKPEDVEKGASAVTTLTTPTGMAVTLATGGNLKAGATASDLTSAAAAVAKPNDAAKDMGGTALTINNVTEDIKAGYKAVKDFLNPPPPPPPPPPKVCNTVCSPN